MLGCNIFQQHILSRDRTENICTLPIHSSPTGCVACDAQSSEVRLRVGLHTHCSRDMAHSELLLGPNVLQTPSLTAQLVLACFVAYHTHDPSPCVFPSVNLPARNVPYGGEGLLYAINCHSHGQRQLRRRTRLLHRSPQSIPKNAHLGSLHVATINGKPSTKAATARVMEAVKAFVKGYGTSKTSTRQQLLQNLHSAAQGRGKQYH